MPPPPMAYLPVFHSPDLDYSLLAWATDSKKLHEIPQYPQSFLPNDPALFLHAPVPAVPHHSRHLRIHPSHPLLRLDVDVRSWNPSASADMDAQLIYPHVHSSSSDTSSTGPSPCLQFPGQNIKQDNVMAYPRAPDYSVDRSSYRQPSSSSLGDSSSAVNYSTHNGLYLPHEQPAYSAGIYHGAQHHQAHQLPQHTSHQQNYSVHHSQPFSVKSQSAIYGAELSPSDSCAPAHSGEVCNPQLVNGIGPLDGQPSSGDGANGSSNSRQTDYTAVWGSGGATPLESSDNVVRQEDLDAEGDADEDLNSLEGPRAPLRGLKGREDGSTWSDVDGSNALVQEPRPYGDNYAESEIDSVEEDEDYVGSDDEFFPSSSRKRSHSNQRDERQLRQRTSPRYPAYSTTSSSSDHGSQTTRSDSTASHRQTYRVRRLHSGSASTSLTFLTLASGAGASSSSATSTSGNSGRRRSRAMSSLPIPVPVPHLTKKSRGRRVPTVSSVEDLTTTIGKRKGNSGKNSRMYLCEVDGCGKCFARGEHLKRHVRSIHTYEKRKPCFFHYCFLGLNNGHSTQMSLSPVWQILQPPR
ncbi:hypothetical protein AX14_002787 [Amanita brunnescens Koide BX004]|nr:hypothetical protein AX14_002787 [Amanita brunnescens Koide BX004]